MHRVIKEALRSKGISLEVYARYTCVYFNTGAADAAPENSSVKIHPLAINYFAVLKFAFYAGLKKA